MPPVPGHEETSKDELRRLQPYPAYKESGVEWLGRTPAHWMLRRLKTIAAIELSNVDKKSVEGQVSVMLCNYTHVYNNEQITSDLDFMAATASPQQQRRFTLQAGDVLITKDSESWRDIAVPALVPVDLPDVLCGYHLALVRPTDEALGAFLARAFSATGLRDQFQIAATGVTRFGLSGEAIRTGLFAIPPTEELGAIARFLERETAKIDALIAKKERLIELLRARRVALITRVVIRGLNPNAQMTDSGVQWLGEIPAHWVVRRLKTLIADPITDGPHETPEFLNEGVPFLSVDGIQEGEIIFEGCRYVSESAHKQYSKKCAPRRDDILLGKAASTGKIARVKVDFEFSVWSPLAVVRADHSEVWPSFLEYALKSAPTQAQIDVLCTSNTQRNISMQDIPVLVVCVAELGEQRAIAAFLDRETARIDDLVTKVRDAIDRLKELRAALISAAATGKVDVRESAAAGRSRPA